MRVEYIRDGLVEEFHDGVYADLNSSDREPYFLRSCAKPLQATLLIDYGIDFTPQEIALCSGSHSGEECHIKVAEGILDKLGLDESYLKCGIHEPLAGLQSGEAVRLVHNNCSGKHLGFLAICKKMGWDLGTYYEPEHPLQIEVKKKLYEICEVNENYPMTTDGCGVPIVSMPLKNLLKGFINLLDYPQIVNSILENPYIFGGKDRLDTEIIQKTGLLAKVGAGGLCVVVNTKIKDGFVIKMYDASMPARRFAVFDAINKLGWGEVDIDRTIKTISDKVVGEVVVK